MDHPELCPNIETKIPKRSFFRKFLDATAEHGTLMTQALCAPVMGVSKQRVHQLVESGKLAVVDIDGKRFIPVTALDLWLSEEKDRGGRPPGTLREMWNTQFRLRDEAKERLSKKIA
jgi:hypothetical protein